MLLLHKLKQLSFAFASAFTVVIMFILLSIPRFLNKCIHMAAVTLISKKEKNKNQCGVQNTNKLYTILISC